MWGVAGAAMAPSPSQGRQQVLAHGITGGCGVRVEGPGYPKVSLPESLAPWGIPPHPWGCCSRMAVARPGARRVAWSRLAPYPETVGAGGLSAVFVLAECEQGPHKWR